MSSPKQTEATVKELPLSKIRLDGRTQTRASLRDWAVEEYADDYRAGRKMPAVVVFDDGENLWMSDGFHRHAGATKAGLATIAAEIRKGTVRDALLYSAGCNGEHGLRRSNEDKRAAVKAVLADPEWSQASDRWIAEKCDVSFGLVADVRSGANSCTSNKHGSAKGKKSDDGGRRTGKDGKTYPAKKPLVLCERCRRVGAVKDCKECKAARAAAAGREPGDDRDTEGAKVRRAKSANGSPVGPADCDQAEDEPSRPAPKSGKNPAVAALGVVIRALDDAGKYERYKRTLDEIMADLRKIA